MNARPLSASLCTAISARCVNVYTNYTSNGLRHAFAWQPLNEPKRGISAAITYWATIARCRFERPTCQTLFSNATKQNTDLDRSEVATDLTMYKIHGHPICETQFAMRSAAT